ncbi:hypothetical protein PybrP1_007070 [[Pythium] brassicae (nom. inval.)]|nr:hypothetical protein PybrP1_007070 [[Pythium] brassicae (nom. inval.)]
MPTSPPPGGPSETPSTTRGGLRRSLLILLAAPLSLTLWSLVAEYAALSTPQSSFLALVRSASDVTSGAQLYPAGVFALDWNTRVPAGELLHVTALHAACVKHKDAVIPWDFGIGRLNGSGDAADAVLQDDGPALVLESDPELLEKLRVCPDVDVFIPRGIRSFGYCEDAAVYTKFLQSRMLPSWVMTLEFRDAQHNRTLTYHDLCPHTPVIVFNHYWEGVHETPSWPAAKPIYLMPNIEMHELKAEQFARADVVLCKTALCARNLNKWFAQEGNPRGTTVLYTRHTTSDVALAARATLGDAAIRPKNYSSVRFTHTAGTSIQKGTSRILDCWITRPDLPPVDVYIAEELYKAQFASYFDQFVQNATNIRVHLGKLNATQFGQVVAESSFFLCPSYQEGYGHYINQARASGGMILTTDVPPMNELITPDSGVLMRAAGTFSFSGQFLGGTSDAEKALRGVDGFVAQFTGKEVCASVAAMLQTKSAAAFAASARRARQMFLFDTIFFAQKMQELREFARAKSHHLRQRHGPRAAERNATSPE